MTNQSTQRIVMVSNRLPIVLSKDDSGDMQIKPGSGGLVTALTPLLRNRKGLWIGWPGCANVTKTDINNNKDRIEEMLGFNISPVMLTDEEVTLYYNGFSNEIIWPLFHDLQSDCNFVPQYWYGYQTVNKKFAEAILSQVSENDFLWIHDYHLLLTAQELRNRGFSSKIAFFLHIPFPPLDVFLKLPWRFQFLKGLLEYDLVGFQTMRDKRNFIQCIKTLLPHLHVERSKGLHCYHLDNHKSLIAVFPISIDFDEFSTPAAEEAWYYREKLPGQKVIFSVDRLDLTKGIPYRLRAICHLLETHPEIHHKVSFVQVVQPSRTDIPIYQNLKNEIDRLVGDINSRFTRDDWVPIKYMYRTMNRNELISCYRTAEVCLVTPFKDGMNLVSKEYAASNVGEEGVLILSEFAGSAAQLHKEALLVNPYDIEGISEMIYKAIHMPLEEQKKRMKAMRHHIKRQDIYWWIESFLQTAISKRLSDFQIIQEYMPTDKEVIDEPSTTLLKI